jgi:hypothetical protein
MLQIDIINMRKVFYVGYHLGSQMFYVSLEGIHDNIHDETIRKLESWSSNWIFAIKFEFFWTQDQPFHI